MTNDIMNKVEVIEGLNTETYAGKAAKAVRTKARGIMGDDLLTFHLLDFVSFILINNRFASKGIIVTPENKEEQYIKIIESGDESLLQDLEKYLNLIDTIGKLEEQRDEYYDIISQLQMANVNDVNAINNIVENYLRR